MYAENTVGHMLTGKAVSRAVRGHMLVDAALNTKLVSMAYPIEITSAIVSDETHQSATQTAEEHQNTDAFDEQCESSSNTEENTPKFFHKSYKKLSNCMNL